MGFIRSINKGMKYKVEIPYLISVSLEVEAEDAASAYDAAVIKSKLGYLPPLHTDDVDNHGRTIAIVNGSLERRFEPDYRTVGIAEGHLECSFEPFENGRIQTEITEEANFPE